MDIMRDLGLFLRAYCMYMLTSLQHNGVIIKAQYAMLPYKQLAYRPRVAPLD